MTEPKEAQVVSGGGLTDPAALVDAGIRASERDDWHSAAEFFGKACRISNLPHHAARYVRALLKAGCPEAALEACDTTPGLQTAQASDRRSELRLLALFAVGKLDEAEQTLASVRAGIIPAPLLIRVINARLNCGKPVATKAIRKHLVATGNEAALCFFEARMADAQGHDMAALEHYARLEKIAPEAWATTARVQLARISARRRDRASAEVGWTQVLAHDPHHIEANRFFLEDAIRQGETARAKALLNQIKGKISASDAILLESRILGDVPGAIALLRQAVNENPNDIGPLIALAFAQLRQHDLVGARQTIEACRSRAPNDLAVNRAYLSWLEFSKASIDVRLKQAQRTLDLAPGDHELMRSVGNLLIRLGRRADALRHYLDAAESSAAPAGFWRMAAELLVEEGRFDEAAALADKAREHFGVDSPWSLVETAEIFFAARRAGEALSFIDAALTLQPDFEQGLRLAGEVELSEGRDFAAAKYLRAFDEQEPAKRRSVLANAISRCMAARSIPFGAGARDAPHNLFPERMFHYLAQTCSPDADPTREGVVHVASSLAAGGAERQLSYALDALKRSGRPEWRPQLVLRTIDPEKGKDFYLDDVLATGAELTLVEDLISSGEARRVLAHRPHLRQTVRSFAAMPAELSDMAIPLLAYLTATRPKIVHFWQDSICISGGIAAMAAGVPAIVLSLRSTIPVEVQRRRRYLREGFLACAAYSGRVAIVNNSEAGARDYEDWLDLEHGSVGVINNGYDFDRISVRAAAAESADIRAGLGIPGDALLIGGVMRFAGEKRPELWIDTVAEAIQLDGRVYGVMIGNGPQWQRMSETVRARGLAARIKLVGRQNPVEPWLAAMDLFILTSSREGLPNVLIEAQALGVPVATTDVGGAAEALPGPKSSILLPEESPNALAQRLLAALGDSEWRHNASARSRNFVRARFSLEASGASLTQLYDDIESDITVGRNPK